MSTAEPTELSSQRRGRVVHWSKGRAASDRYLLRKDCNGVEAYSRASGRGLHM